MWLMSRSSLALCALSLIAFSGCSTDSFTLASPNERSAPRGATSLEDVSDRMRNVRALPAPRLHLRPTQVLSQRYENVILLRHEWSTAAQRYRLTFGRKAGGPAQVEYEMAGDDKLPLEVGERYRVRIFHAESLKGQRFLDEEPARDDTSRGVFVLEKRRRDYPDIVLGGLQGWSMVVRDESNSFIAMLFSGRWRELEPDRNASSVGARSKGFAIEILDRLSYTEVRRTKALCRTVIEHSALAVVAGGRTYEILPGTHSVLSVDKHEYRITAYDASRTLDGGCPSKQEAHVSFSLVKLN
jgi:hypothetical protein